MFLDHPRYCRSKNKKEMPPNQGILDGGGQWEETKDELYYDNLSSASSDGSLSPIGSLKSIPAGGGKSFLGRAASSLLWRARSPQTARGDLRRTAYLDGVRGFAAFMVYLQHHQLWAHSQKDHNVLESSFGTNGQVYLATLPGVRAFFIGGHFAVAIFFIISGYVLSTKPLSLIHAGDHGRLSENVGSALFRRWLRLYIPLIVTTFAFMAFWNVSRIWVYGMVHEKTFRDELWRWYSEGKNFTFVFTQGGDPWFRYNPHLWSIPAEFKGSVVVYTTLIALSRCTRNARLLCMVGLMYYFMYIADGWYGAMFVMGMFQCEIDLLSARGELPSLLARYSGVGPVKKLVMWHLFALAVYLGGVPSHDLKIETLRTNRGWYYLSFLKPQAVFDYKWFYLFVAASIAIAVIPRLPPLKRFFETRFCQYLGRISYGLYLAHGPIIWLVGDRIYTAAGWHGEEQVKNLPGWVDKFPLPKTGPFGMELGYLLPHLVLLPLTLWVSELVTRFVDEPSVRFSQWLYGKTLAPKPIKAIGEA
ncbi:hypothetical protein MCOR07_010595 [Pyricularia oryzae]|nr:hypothetical protein MCOR26_002327 [Pyricularia oryzae]KAI6335262.1 hypothetical protein MCOR29_000417 [Pyricularia oryzae]KAI6378051.1 hypothetical protein MCOR31_000904 [Pyricularia oryzae]KAI6388458.1 hypothetical protein MCOR32_000345 [Pyricularia oryzae]KAI6501264.1 hypothetical protein MCOR11_002160 [Pyricularia oryzae]